MNSTRSLLSAIAVAATLSFLAACGGDDDTAGDDAVTADDDSSTEEAAGADDGGGDTGGSDGDGGDAGGSGGAVGATVTVGDTTYTATEELVCVQLGGALAAQFVDRDAGIDISIDLPPEDWESDTSEDWDPPAVRVDVGDEAQFESGNQLGIVGMPETAVSTYTIDGRTGSGEAEFVDMFQAPDAAEVVAGSFELTCEEK